VTSREDDLAFRGRRGDLDDHRKEQARPEKERESYTEVGGGANNQNKHKKKKKKKPPDDFNQARLSPKRKVV